MKTIRFKSEKVEIRGFTIGISEYGKINDKYRLAVSATFGIDDRQVVTIYQSHKKPFLKNLYLIAVLGLIASCVWFPIVFMLGLFALYFNGAYSFILDKRDITYQRYFGWCNIGLIFILITLLIKNLQS